MGYHSLSIMRWSCEHGFDQINKIDLYYYHYKIKTLEDVHIISGYLHY